MPFVFSCIFCRAILRATWLFGRHLLRLIYSVAVAGRACSNLALSRSPCSRFCSSILASAAAARFWLLQLLRPIKMAMPNSSRR